MAPDLSGQNQTIQLWQDNDGQHYTVDTTLPMYDASSNPPSLNTSRGVIKIVDARNATPEGAQVSFSNLSSADPNGFGPEAVSASVNLSRVYHYYRERFQRDSIDGRGGSILGVINVNMDNAFWNGAYIALGNKNTWAGSLDFNAHEMTHGVITESSNLVYADQSGALNEAFADILGEGCEAHFQNGNLDWILGSGLTRGLRSMKDPASIAIGPGINAPYPSKMSQFLTSSHPDPIVSQVVRQDNGGVHFNSSIINHCFYLLAEGMNEAIGLDDSLRIFYRTVTTKLNPRSSFIDCRLGVIASAEELFGAGSTQARKAGEAFDAVEIFDQAPPTTAPTPIPQVNSGDNTLFTFTNGFNQFLGRLETGLNDGQTGTQISNQALSPGTVPAVSGDGSLAIYVNSQFDAILIETQSGQEQSLGLTGKVFSVGMSPDRSSFGFVFLDDQFNPTNRLSVINLTTDEAKEYDLSTQVFDQTGSTKGSPVLFAQVLDFTPDAGLIYYDALNRITLESGFTVDLWSIYYLDQETGSIYEVIPPLPGANVGNPALGQTHSEYLTFDAQNLDGVNFLYAGNLVTGQVNLLGANGGGTATGLVSRPGYSGDDSALVYTDYSFDPFSGWIPRVDHIALGNDGITTNGNAQIWLNTAVVGAPTVHGVIYRRGPYVGLPTIAATTTDGTAAEAAMDPGTIQLTRTGDVSQSLNVQFLLTGSATNGQDYTEVPLTADFPGGQSEINLAFQPIDDGLAEGEESVTLTITKQGHYTIADPGGTASIKIADNDAGDGNLDNWLAENGLAPDQLGIDPDRDRFPNLVEYALGLDPGKPDGSQAIRSTIIEEAN
ncbi:MAG: M4 family metallopeptidase, partial [Verrucomicrobiota bacterium]